MTADVRALGRAVVPDVHRALREGVDDGAFPGGTAAVFLKGRLVHLSATGDAQGAPARLPAHDGTLFDLASVTKLVATTSAAALLLARKAIALDEPVWRYFPPFGRVGKKAVTVRHLLAHSSGLPAWRPFFLKVMGDPGAAMLFAQPPVRGRALHNACRRGHAMVTDLAVTAALEAEPGARRVYSDLGFIVLGRLVEEVASARLDEFVRNEVLRPLRVEGASLASLAFRPLDDSVRELDVAATGLFRPREPAPGQEGQVPAPEGPPPAPRPGEVDDDNAFAMGGVAGHAGLFGEARDVAAFGAAVLQELAGAGRIAPAEVWEELCAPDPTPGSRRGLGFDMPSAQGSAAGARLAASRTVGHLGFTGCSLWIDRDRELSVALLTNRVHPTRANTLIQAFRPRFHDAVVEALEAET